MSEPNQTGGVPHENLQILYENNVNVQEEEYMLHYYVSVPYIAYNVTHNVD